MKFLKLVILCLAGTNYAYTNDMVVNVPVASLRTVPQDYTIGQEHDEKESRDMFGASYDIFMEKLTPGLRDPRQDTQLLFNEHVTCLEDLNNGWLKVELPEQYGYNSGKQRFEQVIGYIKKEQVVVPGKEQAAANIVVSVPWATITTQNDQPLTIPMGTKLHGIKKNQTQYQVNLPDGRHGSIALADVYLMNKTPEPENILRTLVVARAKQLVGGPYCWGGCSPHAQGLIDVAPSCDCSGLVRLSYEAAGAGLPRNAHPQWLRSAKVEKGAALKPGDLIFFARPTRPDRVHHVLMYLGNNLIIESCVSQGVVIQKSEERFGQPVATLTYGSTIKAPSMQGTCSEYVIYFGSYLQDKERVEYMRDYALGNYDVNRWVKDNQISKK
jgi:cell wall-associated NlpC family hydrolase